MIKIEISGPKDTDIGIYVDDIQLVGVKDVYLGATKEGKDKRKISLYRDAFHNRDLLNYVVSQLTNAEFDVTILTLPHTQREQKLT